MCAYCDYDVRVHRDAGFDQDLLRDLDDPEPETAVRAAFLLGVRRAAGAAEALERCYERTVDPFLQREVVAALDRVGGPIAERLMTRASTSPRVVVRAEALRRLIRNGGSCGEGALIAARSDASPFVRLAALRPARSASPPRSGADGGMAS